MAVKRARKRVSHQVVREVTPVLDIQPVEERPKRSWKKWVWVAAAVGLLAVWWWKTNTWPVVAMVGWRPVTRYEVEQAMWKQNGELTLDGLITQKLVEAELDKLGVKADPARVSEQLDKMKAAVPEGQTWEQELAARGFTEKQIRELVEIQVRISQVVESQATVSASEVEDYVKANGKYLTGKTDDERKKEAEDAIKQGKLGSAFEQWVQSVRTNGEKNVWRIGK